MIPIFIFPIVHDAGAPQRSAPTRLASRPVNDSLADVYQVPWPAILAEEELVRFVLAREHLLFRIPLQLLAGPIGDVPDARNGGGPDTDFDVCVGILSGTNAIDEVLGVERRR